MDTQSRFGLAISILNRSASAYFTRELKPLGIGPGQQAYLLALLPGEVIHQDTLAARLQVDKANVTRAVAALEQQGLLQRRTAPHDRRSRQISLTPSGEAVQQEVQQIAALWVGRLQESVSDNEWDALVSLLQRVSDAAVQAARLPASSI